jgi:DNA polymerase I
MRFVFDLEANGLLKEATKMWVLVAIDVDTQKEYVFPPGDDRWKDLISNADELIGHNIINYDRLIFRKLYGFEIPESVRLTDTLIYSQILDYYRFDKEGHSLEVWGRYFGQLKVEHEDWSQYSPEMLNRCRTDVALTLRVYEKLMEEFRHLREKAPEIETYIEAEHHAMYWTSDAYYHGWPFDYRAALQLKSRLEEKMKEAKDRLQERLGWKAVAVDMCKGEVAVKEAKWTKDGFYTLNIAKWFDIDPVSGYEGEERLVEGDYCRVSFEKLKLSSTQDVKLFLERNGWEPTEWNWKKDPYSYKRIQMSPKITEDSLEFLGGDGKLYTEYLSASSRHSILETWLANVDDDSKLHGDCVLIGTPSMRTRHQTIVNVPSVDSEWGPEMRALFKTLPGWKLVGADSSGNQARSLAHYLGDEEFIHVLLNEDIHTYNAEKLNEVLISMGYDPEATRAKAKRIFYAFLFGASGGKLWSYIFGRVDEKAGKKLRLGFLKAVPGFEELLNKLENIYGSTQKFGIGYIPSLAGNRLYVDSWHKLLVYLLQGAEKITCSTALMLTRKELIKRKIPFVPLIYMHDEFQLMTPEEYAEEVKEISANSFKEGPKLYGIEIMDGEGKVGNNWLETH